MTALKAENLLQNSHILTQIKDTIEGLTYESSGEMVSYDDMCQRVTEEIDSLPRLALSVSVAPGTESQYSIQLTHSMEEVADRCELVTRRASRVESKVRDALGRMKRLQGEFEAWYTLEAGPKIWEKQSEALAAAALLSGGAATKLASPVNLSATQIKHLATSEFSRLINGLDIEFESKWSILKILIKEIKEHKKTQMDKYAMGKDQVNASWTSHMPLFNGGDDINRDELVPPEPKSLLEEDTEDEIPLEFISKKSGEIKGTFKKVGTPQPITVIEEPVA